MIVRVSHPDQLRSLIPDMTRLFGDFLRRAGEPFTVEAQWIAVVRALAEGDRTLFLVAFDQKTKPVGYALAQIGFDFWTIQYLNVVQMYVSPKHRKVSRDLEAWLLDWAKERGCQAISAISRRHARPLVRRFRMEPLGVLYARLMKEEEQTPDGKGPTTTTAVDEHDSAGVPAVRAATYAVS